MRAASSALASSVPLEMTTTSTARILLRFLFCSPSILRQARILLRFLFCSPSILHQAGQPGSMPSSMVGGGGCQDAWLNTKFHGE